MIKGNFTFKMSFDFLQVPHYGGMAPYMQPASHLQSPGKLVLKSRKTIQHPFPSENINFSFVVCDARYV